MGKIYENMQDYEEAMEKEFKIKCEEVAMYQGNRKRLTIDTEWEYEELKDDVYSEALKILNGTDGKDGWLMKHKGRMLKDPDLVYPEFIVEDICNRFDLIEVYNRAYDKHRNDEHKMFGIHYFDELASAEIKKVLNNNLVT